ncbi:MAG: hypothetical protein ACKVTZ_03800 [Bacteroidia bacterium]
MINFQRIKGTFLHYTDGILENKIISVYVPFAIIIVAVANYYGQIYKYNVNVPCSDDYGVALQFLNSFVTEDSFWNKIALLFRQHVDHRVMFPRLAVLVDFYLRGKVDFYSLVIFGNLGLLWIGLILFYSFPNRVGKILLFCPVGLLLFQLQHWENSGFPTASIQSFYVIFFSFTSLYFLSRDSKRDLALACFASFLAVFTSGNGMFCILPGAFILINQKKYKALGVWMLTFLCLLSFYFYQYSHQNTKLLNLLSEKPLQIMTNFLVAIGGFINYSKAWEPIGPGYPLSIAFGVLVTVFFLYLTFSKYYLRSPVLYGFLLFLLITCAAMAVSRVTQYSPNELSTVSRYKIVSVCCISVSYLTLMDIWPGMGLLKAIVFIPLGVYYNTTANEKNIMIFKAHTERLIQSSWAVYSHNDYTKILDGNPALSALTLKESKSKDVYVLPDLTDKYLRLAIPARQLINVPWENFSLMDTTVKYNFLIQSTSNNDTYAVRGGWALKKGKTTKRNFLILTSSFATYYFSTAIDYRDDLTEMMKMLDPEDQTIYTDSGFNFSIKTSQLLKGEYEAGIVLETWDRFYYYLPSPNKVIVE